MNKEEIIEKIRQVIHESCGISLEEIKPDSTLFDELNIDSIDMVDILFNLERAYDIELKISEIEKYSKQEMGDEPFEIDHIITAKGLEVLKRRLPEIDHSKVIEGITIHDIVKLINITSLANMVLTQIDRKKG
jgi:acyl carrier protein